MSYNPYKVLSVDPAADPDIIVAAYRTLSKKYHPDVNKSSEASARMQEINKAYEMLKDPDQRKRVDADLARGTTSGSGGRVGFNTNRTSTPTRRSNPSAGPDFGKIGDEIFRRAGSAFNSVRGSMNDRTLYFYQKQLSDEVQHKSIKVSVFHDANMNQKICSVQLSAPDRRGQPLTAEILLDSGNMFDLVLAISDAQATRENATPPIEMNAEYDVYYRQIVGSLSRNYIAIEIIKKTRSTDKETIISIGEKNARSEKEGVLADQTPKQLEQVGRIFQSALEAMRQ